MPLRDLALVLVLLLWIVPSAAAGGEPLRIGLDIPLTGPAADIGQYLFWGAETAVQEVNATGGVLGRNVALTTLDDETDPLKAAANVRRMLDQDKVAAVLGPANSGNALAMIPLMQQAQKPLMLLTASATKLTSIYQDTPPNYIFRAVLADQEQLRALVNWAAPRYPRIAIAHDTTPYGRLAQQDMLGAMAEHGLAPVAVVGFDLGELDMSAQVRALAASGAQAVAILGLGNEVANLLRSADSLGYRPQFIGQYPFFLHPVQQLPSRLSDGIKGVLSSTAEDSPKARELDARVRTDYGYTGYYPFKFVEAGYEGTRLLLQAIAQAGSDSGPAVRDALENIERFEGVRQTFIRPFSPTWHDLYRGENLYVATWDNGRIRRVEN